MVVRSLRSYCINSIIRRLKVDHVLGNNQSEVCYDAHGVKLVQQRKNLVICGGPHQSTFFAIHAVL